MTINSEVRTAGPYTGSGGTGPFAFAFEIFATSELLVQTKKISDGTIATLALTTDYTVSLNANQNTSPGGTITLVASLSSAYTLAMTSNVQFKQATQLTNNGPFFAKTITTCLDRLTILAQQVKVTATRAIKFPIVDGTSLTTDLPAAAQRASKALIFDVSGNVTVSADNYNDQVATVAASAAAAAASAGTANADVVLTHADVVLTHADVVTTGNNVTTATTQAGTATTQAGIATTQAGTATTQAGIATTQAGTATTQAGLAATAKTNCDSDKTACDADVVLTHADVVLTHADVVLTHADVVLTHADVVTTGNNVTTATTQAGTATTQATNASASAVAAAASAAAASASAAGISMKSSCRVASTAALTVTYVNGTSGVGATLTNAGAQAAIAIDGVTLAVNDRVLVKDQASGLQNGIYSATTLGDGTHNWVLTRVTDYDQAAEIIEGTATIIEEGTTNASHIYVMTHNGAITVGTTAIDWTSLTANATSANTLTTPRAIYGNNFDGSAALSQIIASTYGGTGNGFTKFSGPTTSEKTFTLPNANATVLTDNALVTSAQGGTGNGFTKFSGPTTAEKTKTVRDASDTILELGGSYTPTGNFTNMQLITPTLGTPASGTLTNCTGYTEANLSTTDITTNNVSTSKHGFAPKAPNDATQFLNGANPPAYSTPSVSTLVAPTAFNSATTFAVTGLPTGIKKLFIYFNGVTFNATSDILIQIGNVTDTLKTSGYLASGTSAFGGTVGTSAYTAGFGIRSATASTVISGMIELDLVDSSNNKWVGTGSFEWAAPANSFCAGSQNNMSAVLDRFTVTTVGGTATWTAGSISYSYSK